MGVNEYVEEDGTARRRDPEDRPQTERDQVERLKEFKATRDQEAVARAAAGPARGGARASGNLLYPIKDALRDRATIGEVCNVMREVFGEYKPPV